MVEFLLHNTLGAWWVAKRKAEGKDPSLDGIEFTYLRYKEDGTAGRGHVCRLAETAKELRVLDPCMGSGHFLVAMLPILVAMRMEEKDWTKAEACERCFATTCSGWRSTRAARRSPRSIWRWPRGNSRATAQLPPLNLACSGWL